MRADKLVDKTSHIDNASEELISRCGELSGFIVKRSPTCADASAKLYNSQHNIINNTTDGIFANKLKQSMPNLPIEDEGRLNDYKIREHFIKRVYLYYHAKQLLLKPIKLDSLQEFHANNKMMLHLHRPQSLINLGRLLATETGMPMEQLVKSYHSVYIRSFNHIATRNQHYSILQRTFKLINNKINSRDRKDIQDHLSSYLKGYLPLVAPIVLLKHYANHFSVDSLVRQSYLSPYPEDLCLMNNI